jgi:hypothetical protein
LAVVEAAVVTAALLIALLPVTPAGAKDGDGKAPAAKPIVIEGQLTASDPKDTKLKGSPANLHKVKLTKGTVYVVDLVSKDFDAYLRLEDSGGRQLVEDDDGGGATNARLFFIPPESAEYTVIATCYKPKTGKYRLTVQAAQLQSKVLTLENGSATAKGRLTPTGPRSPFSPHNSCAMYRADFKRGATYVIDLASADFDAYLSLADASLRLLASDDDSGGKLNSRLRFECKADGTFFLVATGVGHPEGAFELKVRAAD